MTRLPKHAPPGSAGSAISDARRHAPLFERGRITIMGVLNLTPDSFSDGGRFVHGQRVDAAGAVEAALALVEAGADIVDVGGESTRPGAAEVSVAEETERTAPVIEAIAKAVPVSISIDTRKAAVAEAALAAGAGIVNDVSGLAHDPVLAEVAARAGAWLVLGHLRGDPATMQRSVAFDDPVTEVADDLSAACDRACTAGVARERLVADPGIGFGKRLPHNLALLAEVERIRARVGAPVLVGPSRKSFLGELTGDPVTERDDATHAACAVAIFAGADAIRVHDVAGARRAAAVGLALRGARDARR